MARRARLDPPSRPADGSRAWDKVGNKDPNRYYVLVDPNDQKCGLEPYMADPELDWQMETHREDGPRPVVGRKAEKGANVMTGGMQLISCPLEQWQAKFEREQASIGVVERRILADGGIDDPLRGRHGRYKVEIEDEPAVIGLRGA